MCVPFPALVPPGVAAGPLQSDTGRKDGGEGKKKTQKKKKPIGQSDRTRQGRNSSGTGSVGASQTERDGVWCGRRPFTFFSSSFFCLFPFPSSFSFLFILTPPQPYSFPLPLPSLPYLYLTLLPITYTKKPPPHLRSIRPSSSWAKDLAQRCRLHPSASRPPRSPHSTTQSSRKVSLSRSPRRSFTGRASPLRPRTVLSLRPHTMTSWKSLLTFT